MCKKLCSDWLCSVLTSRAHAPSFRACALVSPVLGCPAEPPRQKERRGAAAFSRPSSCRYPRDPGPGATRSAPCLTLARGVVLRPKPRVAASRHVRASLGLRCLDVDPGSGLVSVWKQPAKFQETSPSACLSSRVFVLARVCPACLFSALPLRGQVFRERSTTSSLYDNNGFYGL